MVKDNQQILQLDKVNQLWVRVKDASSNKTNVSLQTM